MEQTLVSGKDGAITVGCDFGSGDASVEVLMCHRANGIIEVHGVREFRLRHTEPPVVLRQAKLKEKREPITYGPERKSRGGKTRRW